MPLLALALANWRLVGIGLAVAALLGWLAYERAHYISIGEQRATQKIEEANDAAKRKADAGSDLVEGCFATGGVWSRSRGVCEHPATGQ